MWRQAVSESANPWTVRGALVQGPPTPQDVLRQSRNNGETIVQARC